MDRVTDLADPCRCKGAAPGGQCLYLAEPGNDYCRLHGGSNKEVSRDKRQYHLTNARYRSRLAQLTDHEEIKSLRDEIGLTRILIEELWNSCKNETDLLASCHSFNQLFQTLDRLVKTSHQTEQSLGTLLSKAAVIRLGQRIADILIDELQDIDGFEEKVDRINCLMFDAIEHTTNEVEENS